MGKECQLRRTEDCGSRHSVRERDGLAAAGGAQEDDLRKVVVHRTKLLFALRGREGGGVGGTTLTSHHQVIVSKLRMFSVGFLGFIFRKIVPTPSLPLIPAFQM